MADSADPCGPARDERVVELTIVGVRLFPPSPAASQAPALDPPYHVVADVAPAAAAAVQRQAAQARDKDACHPPILVRARGSVALEVLRPAEHSSSGRRGRAPSPLLSPRAGSSSSSASSPAGSPSPASASSGAGGALLLGRCEIADVGAECARGYAWHWLLDADGERICGELLACARAVPTGAEREASLARLRADIREVCELPAEARPRLSKHRLEVLLSSQLPGPCAGGGGGGGGAPAAAAGARATGHAAGAQHPRPRPASVYVQRTMQRQRSLSSVDELGVSPTTALALSSLVVAQPAAPQQRPAEDDPALGGYNTDFASLCAAGSGGSGGGGAQASLGGFVLPIAGMPGSRACSSVAASQDSASLNASKTLSDDSGNASTSDDPASDLHSSAGSATAASDAGFGSPDVGSYVFMSPPGAVGPTGAVAGPRTPHSQRQVQPLLRTVCESPCQSPSVDAWRAAVRVPRFEASPSMSRRSSDASSPPPGLRLDADSVEQQSPVPGPVAMPTAARVRPPLARTIGPSPPGSPSASAAFSPQASAADTPRRDEDAATGRPHLRDVHLHTLEGGFRRLRDSRTRGGLTGSAIHEPNTLPVSPPPPLHLAGSSGVMGSCNSDAMPPPLFDFNERFQLLCECVRDLDKVDASYEQRLRINEEIISLYKDFRYCAKTYGRIIISERFLTDEEKTIRPIVDEYASGSSASYLVNNVTFKFAGVESDTFAKVAGHELKSLVHIFNCQLPIALPLVALVDFSDTLVFGGVDRPLPRAVPDGMVVRVMEDLASSLNLCVHSGSHGTRVYTSAYNEVHKGTDGRAARTTRLLRPEYVVAYKEKLCSDAFSAEVDQTEGGYANEVVTQATQHLLHSVIPETGKWLVESVCDAAMHGELFEFSVKAALHSRGVNLRYMGRLLDSIRGTLFPPHMRSAAHNTSALLMIEMTARCLRSHLNSRLRNVTARFTVPLEAPYIAIYVDMLKMLSPESSTFSHWDKILPLVSTKYEVDLMTEGFQGITRFYPERFFKPNAGKHLLLLRVLELTGCKLKHRVLSFLDKSPAMFDKVVAKIDEGDIKKIGERLKDMNVINSAEGYLLKLSARSSADPSYVRRCSLKTFYKALAANPNNTVTLRNIAQLLVDEYMEQFAKQGICTANSSLLLDRKMYQAYQCYRDAVKSSPTNAESRFQYAEFLDKLRLLDPEQVLEQVLVALHHDPVHHRALTLLQGLCSNKPRFLEEWKLVAQREMSFRPKTAGE
eukprot:m51a1_g3494 hypothetical protein (1246) ;mRNA; f:805569-810077